MVFKARCFGCDWGLTLAELNPLMDLSLDHLGRGCPGPVIVLDPLDNTYAVKKRRDLEEV